LKWGKFEFLFLLELQQAEADDGFCRAWRRTRGVTKKIVTALSSHDGEAANGHVVEFSQEVGDAKEMAAAVELGAGRGARR